MSRDPLRRRLGRIAPWWRRFKRNGYRPDRCAHCGHGFHWSRDARFATGNRDGKHYHGPCLSYLTWRRKAEDRLTVLGVTAELTGVTSSDVREAMSFRASDGRPMSGSSEWSLAWAVFNDLEKAAAKEPTP